MSHSVRAIALSLTFAVLLASQAIPAAAGLERVDTDEQDPVRLSSRLGAPQGLYPGIVALRLSGRGHCNAILIRPDWALTEAHCVLLFDAKKPKPMPPKDLEVLYGDVDLKKAKAATVEQIILHEGYDRRTFENDLALLKLRAPLSLEPLTVARQKLEETIERQGEAGGAVVTGWGSFFEEERVRQLDRQRHLSVRVIPREECNRSYPGKVQSGHVCAYSIFKKIDVCQGFGGGPLMLPTAKGRFEVLGMVSWGEGCARPGKPTVYTYLPHYIPWIESKIGPLPVDPAAVPPPPSPPPPRSPAQSPAPEAKRPAGGRIVNPNPNIAPTGLFRYMVSLGEAEKNQALGHFCGGTLLHKRWVLTAAHCVADLVNTPEKIQLKLDSEILSRGGVYLSAKRVIVHEDYAKGWYGDLKNDIALIEVAGDVPTDIVVPPLATPQLERELLGPNGDDPRDIVVIGWGKNAFSRFGKISDHLHWTSVRMVRRTACNAPKSYDGRIDATVYCAGKEDVDSCEGDSGGPLLATDRNREFVLIGLVSWGEGCSKDDKPGVYVRLPLFHDWIAKNMK